MTRRNKRNEKDTWRRTTKATGSPGTSAIIFISPFAALNHFKWREFTLSVSLKVFIRQRYKPDTPEVVMEVKRHFLVGQTGPERRCHSLLEGSHLFSDVTQIELCELPVLLLVINHRAMSSQKEARGKACF